MKAKHLPLQDLYLKLPLQIQANKVETGRIVSFC